MTMRDVLNLMDHEVWVCGTNVDGTPLFTVWPADWIGGHKETLDELEPWLDYDADDMRMQRYPDPEHEGVGLSFIPMITCTLYPPKNDVNRRFCLRYRGCAKGDIPPTKAQDSEASKIVVMSLAEILEEINRDRSSHWTDYDETDWKEGLDEWTWYELIGEVV